MLKREILLRKIRDYVEKILKKQYDAMIVIGDNSYKLIRFLEKCENIKMPQIYNEKYLKRCYFNLEQFQNKKILLFVDIVDTGKEVYEYYEMLRTKFKVSEENIDIRAYSKTEYSSKIDNIENFDYCNESASNYAVQIWMEEILLWNKEILTAENDLLYFETKMTLKEWKRFIESHNKYSTAREFNFGMYGHNFGYILSGNCEAMNKQLLGYIQCALIKYNYIVLDNDIVKVIFTPYIIDKCWNREEITILYNAIVKGKLTTSEMTDKTYMMMHDVIITSMCYSLGYDIMEWEKLFNIQIKINTINIKSSWEKEFVEIFDDMQNKMENFKRYYSPVVDEFYHNYELIGRSKFVKFHAECTAPLSKKGEEVPIPLNANVSNIGCCINKETIKRSRQSHKEKDSVIPLVLRYMNRIVYREFRERQEKDLKYRRKMMLSAAIMCKAEVYQIKIVPTWFGYKPTLNEQQGYDLKIDQGFDIEINLETGKTGEYLPWTDFNCCQQENKVLFEIHEYIATLWMLMDCTADMFSENFEENCENQIFNRFSQENWVRRSTRHRTVNDFSVRQQAHKELISRVNFHEDGFPIYAGMTDIIRNVDPIMESAIAKTIVEKERKEKEELIEKYGGYYSSGVEPLWSETEQLYIKTFEIPMEERVLDHKLNWVRPIIPYFRSHNTDSEDLDR